MKHLLLCLTLLLPQLSWAASADNTSSQYKPTNGAAGSVSGVVIQQSDDAYNSIPINSAHPLPTYTGVPAASSSSGLAPVVSTTAEDSHVLKSSAGNLYGVCTTNGGTTGYVMLFNATSAPANGAVTPTAWIAMPSTTYTACYDNGNVPLYFSTGITVVYSSTGPFTLTKSATAAFSAKVK